MSDHSDPLEPGTQAPDWELKATPDQTVKLSDFRGRDLIMAFYPADWSPVCTDQMALYNEILPEFKRLGAELVGISIDHAWCHVAFAQSRKLRFPLLADFHPKGEMSSAYGAYLPDWGTTNRSLVVVGEDGVVRWSHAEEAPNNIPGANLIFDAIENAD
jgi:peroxiredoxin